MSAFLVLPSLKNANPRARVSVEPPSSSVSWAYFSTIRFDPRRQADGIVCQAASSTALVSLAARSAKIHGPRVPRFHRPFPSTRTRYCQPLLTPVPVLLSDASIIYSSSALIDDLFQLAITLSCMTSFCIFHCVWRAALIASCLLITAGQLHLPV